MAYWVNKNKYEAEFQESHIHLLIVYNKCCSTNIFAIKNFKPYRDFKINKEWNILHKMNEYDSII